MDSAAGHLQRSRISTDAELSCDLWMAVLFFFRRCMAKGHLEFLIRDVLQQEAWSLLRGQ